MNRLLRNARLADGRLVDLAVSDGRIVSVDEAVSLTPSVNGSAAGSTLGSSGTEDSTITDLGGWLTLPAMAEPHAHLDKALTAEAVPNPTGDLMGAIEAWVDAAGQGMFTYDNTMERAAAAMELLLVHGVTAVRTHVNVLGSNQTISLRAIKEAAARFDGLLDVQTVALTSSPVTGTSPEAVANRQALYAAVSEGVDFVGGCPHLDPDGPGVIRQAITIAADAGIGIDLHVDEMLDPSVLTLRDFARQIIDHGFEGLVAASHCVTLGMQSPEVQREVAALVAEANMAVFPLPQTNLFLQGRDHPTATPRGLTALDALLEAGVVVAAGGDNVQDPFNLVGRSDPLETAALMVMAGHRLPDEAYDMVSNRPRAAMGLPTVSLQPGDPADLVALDAPSIRGAIADAPMSRRVFRRGLLVASA
ncbi:MAG: amidohydrolase family protein, partial [Acidimicrobiia bacterium]|nr:amidohydrolase family protein [Acidimicrobiia bacterium]